MSDKNLVITLDGPAGVGKTSLAKAVACELSIAYLDSGAMFRAVAYNLGLSSLNWSGDKLQQALSGLEFSLQIKPWETLLLLNQKPVGEEIREEAVGLAASTLATQPAVREHLKKEQQRLGEQASLVAEGRDMGSVIFPAAPFKFFLQARPEERARRRWLQLLAQGKHADLQKITQDIVLRDKQDQERSLAPLIPAAGAITLDTTCLDEKQALQSILEHIHAAGHNLVQDQP